MSGATAVAIGTAVAGAVVSNLLAPKPKKPTVERPTPMPGQDAKKNAARLSLIDQQQRQGRASTILTDSSDTLG